jgi:DNA-binding NtrC family response regulator
MRSLTSLDAGSLQENGGARKAAKVLEELSNALSVAAEALQASRFPDVERGIDFYEEVSRFEAELIRRALKLTGGQQRRAARLLGLKVTTLNAKLRQYGIEPRPPDTIFER